MLKKKWCCMSCLHVWWARREPKKCPECGSLYIGRGARDLKTSKERRKGK